MREPEQRRPAHSTYELSKPYRYLYSQYLTERGYEQAKRQIEDLHTQCTVRDLARIFLNNTHDEPGRLAFASATLIHGIDTDIQEPELIEVDNILRRTFSYAHNPNSARYLFDLANETDISYMQLMIKDILLADAYLSEYPFRLSGPPLEYADLLRLETDLKHRKDLRDKLRRTK